MTRKFGRSAMAIALASSFALACANDVAAPTGLASPGVALSSRDRHVGAQNDESAKNEDDSHSTACATRLARVDSGVFGPKGGTLTFGTSRLIIPAGALHAPVTITATVLGGNSSRVDFQPHGLLFSKAAGLQLDTVGCDVDEDVAPDVVYLSDTGGVLEIIKAVYDKKWHTIAAPIWHFSGYAIAF